MADRHTGINKHKKDGNIVRQRDRHTEERRHRDTDGMI